MLADIYVTEKLRELRRGAAGSQRPPTMPALPLIARSVGRLLCRAGERLQWMGEPRERDLRDASAATATRR